MNFNNDFFNNEDLKMLQHLSYDEQIKLIKEYHQGSKEARDILIENNIRYVIFAVRCKFRINNCDSDDLINTGIIGLIKGIDTFNLEKGIKPFTYFAACIDNEILMFLRKNKKNRYISRSLDEPAFRDDCDDTLKDLLIDNTDFEEDLLNLQVRNQMLELVKKVLEQIPEKHQEAVKLYFGFYDKLYTQEEIANKLGVSQSYASRLIRKTTNLLKKKFEDIEIFSYDDLENFDYSLLDQSIELFETNDKTNSEQTEHNDDIVSSPNSLSKKLLIKK